MTGRLPTDSARSGYTEIVDGDESGFIRSPDWSPDGSLIAFQDTSKGIALVQPDGGQKSQVAHTEPGDAFPAWRPLVEDPLNDIIVPSDGDGAPQFYFTLTTRSCSTPVSIANVSDRRPP